MACSYIVTKGFEEAGCHCNWEVLLQSNWDLAVGWMQVPRVGEAKTLCCRNVESEASIVVRGGTYVCVSGLGLGMGYCNAWDTNL